MIDHKQITKLVPVEISGLSKKTDLSLKDKEKYYEIIKQHINQNTKNIKTHGQKLKRDGYLHLGNVLDSNKLKEELRQHPIYRGHIKNELYSDEVPIHEY